jgi:hypothetical protein
MLEGKIDEEKQERGYLNVLILPYKLNPLRSTLLTYSVSFPLLLAL